MYPVWRKAHAARAMAEQLAFGVEIETVGLSRRGAAVCIQSVVGGRIEYRPSYDRQTVIAADGREWHAMADGSLDSENGYVAEVVTPKLCGDADLETLQKVVRALRTAGASVNESCGLHVHVDGTNLTAAAAARVGVLFGLRQDMLYRACGVQERRVARYCKKLDSAKIAKLKRATTREQLAAAWYEERDGATAAAWRGTQHYDQSRYYGINLHSYFYRGTIEFRLFEGTLHAGKIKAAVQLARAMVAYGSTAQRNGPVLSTSRHMNLWLQRIGMLGASFKGARKHLTALFPERQPVAAPVAAPVAM